MTLPERINATWIRSLDDAALVAAESELHTLFVTAERDEKIRRGEAYDLMRGPAPLMHAWQRWSTVNAATRSRGLHPRLPR